MKNKGTTALENKWDQYNDTIEQPPRSAADAKVAASAFALVISVIVAVLFA